MNLFWSTRSLTSNREDHLTEFFAAALELSPIFRARYAALLLGEYASRQGWPEPIIARVETQVSYPGASSQPDLRLTLDDGHVILVEHKLEAPETVERETGERNQLQRYLALPVDGVEYVCSSFRSLPDTVLADPRYIRPSNRDHFLWRDFYPLLDDQDRFLGWLKEGFERLGFTPPLPGVGELSGPDSEEIRRNRENFAKLWGSTRRGARELGWHRIEAGDIVELYLSEGTSDLAASVFVSPAKAERFLIRVTPKPGRLGAVIKVMEEAARSAWVPTEVANRQVTRKGKVNVVDVTSSLHALLNREEQPAEMERRLANYVLHFLRRL